MARVARQGASAPVAVEPGSLVSLLRSWELSLRAARKSPKTIRSYLESGRQLADFLGAAGMPVDVAAIRREHVEAFIVDVMDQWAVSTAATRFRGLQQLFKWMVEEGEIERSPMERMRPPKLEEVPVPVLGEADLKKLIASCKGKEFVERRDEAIIRLFADGGPRCAELVGLRVEDIDFDLGVAYVTGKGARGRAVPFGDETARALDRYLRVRARHRLARLDALWLGTRGAMTDSGVRQVVKRRGQAAGIEDLHPHVLRHSSVHHFLSDGGQEGDAMRIYGWKSRQMLDRYGASAADQRAREAHRRHGIGDRI